jgi:hypothetical protein
MGEQRLDFLILLSRIKKNENDNPYKSASDSLEPEDGETRSGHNLQNL